ncbi:hypothetical protein [Tenacibaculum sp. SDUM215027]|uniref:hypothetical protein n=1 Tax=Tenacibaculum sp. SDUM215027 TaxID=3422596 RepID=UPI003D31FBEE
MNTNSKEYFLHHKFGNNNYQIYVNDILVSSSVAGNGIPAPYEINQYLFLKGAQKLRINVQAPIKLKKYNISQKDILDFKGKTLITLLENEAFSNIKNILEATFYDIKQSTPVIEQEWEFEAELPIYCDNLENSEDLSKWDEKELEKVVVNRFTELRDLLNDGNGNQVYTEVKKATESIFIAEYMDNSEQQEFSTNITDFFTSHKGTMLPIENYHLRLMGNGKAVALEYATGKLQGLGILSSEDIEENTRNINYFILHKPKSSNKFEVFRYNSSYTAIE